MFDSHTDTLVQFRLPSDWPLPDFVRYLGEETSSDRDERAKRNERAGAMRTLLDRNGASLAETHERLAVAGLKLADAYAQRRATRVTEFRMQEKPYLLLTFAFRSAGETGSDVDALFKDLARQRWEFVSVRVNDTRATLCILAKTKAQVPKLLDTVEDHKAAPFGIVVSKSVRKRKAARRSVIGQALVAAQNSREPDPPQQRATSQKKPPAKASPQLNRLLGHGWKIEREDAGCVHLFKERDGDRRTMVHHHRKRA